MWLRSKGPWHDFWARARVSVLCAVLIFFLIAGATTT